MRPGTELSQFLRVFLPTLVRFVLKKSITHFKILIIPHALHFVASCIIAFYLI